MYYRYEARDKLRKEIENSTFSKPEWEGIFQCMDPDQRRKWYCLTIPKWYEKNPEKVTEAWFTEHGFEKYKEKMQETIRELEENDWEIRIRTAETLDNIVMKGKTQCIRLL